MPTIPVSIDAGPAVPTSADAEATFDAAYEAFNAWEKNQLVPQANALADNVYDNAVEAATAASTANTKAGEASTSASDADAARAGAETARTGSEDARDAALVAAGAAGAAAGLPSLAGKGGQFLQGKLDETGYQLAPIIVPAPFEVGDILASARPLALPQWLPCDQSLRLKASFPALAAALPLYPILSQTSRTLPSSAERGGLSYGNGRWLAVTTAPSTDQIAYSLDGVTWVSRTLPGISTWKSSAHEAGLFVVVGNAQICTSPDAITWTGRAAPSITFNDVVFASGLFVAVGFSGCATSADGITWTARTIPAGTYNKVVFGNGVFVALGASGVLATSLDGITWTARAAFATSSGVGFACFGAGRFVAVGNFGQLFHSTDGITWTLQPQISNAASVHFSGGVFFLTADFSPAWNYLSSDGLAWQRTPVGASGTQRSGVVFAQNKWISTQQGATSQAQEFTDVFDNATLFRLPPANGSLPCFVRAAP